MTALVIDASALLALLRGERGGDRVAEVLADAAMATVNLSEVVAALTRDGIAEDETRAILAELAIETVAFDADLAFASGLMLALTKPAGLSLADRACLALAQRLRVKAMTADRAWAQIADAVSVEVELIR